MWSPDTDVSNSAVTALQNFIKLNPDDHIVLIMNQMLDFMELTFSQPSEKVLYALKNFCFILDFYADYMEKSNLIPKIGI